MPAPLAKVLVVDHGTTVLPIIVAIVGDAGYDVQVCASTIAVIVAEGYQPDVVIFDLVMPGPYTCDLLTHFRRALPHIPVVLIGQEVDARTTEHLLNKEAFAYITKPFTAGMITDVLRRALDE
jgi:DNA-binding NtrC family response regulator